MAIYVDFVGLNTLIQEPVDTTTNQIGDLSTGQTFDSSEKGFYNFDNVRMRYNIAKRDYLVALNTHRNGPYGWPIFRQIRNSDNAITRKQRIDNNFTHFEYPGNLLTYNRGTTRIVVPRRRKPVKAYVEVPVVSKHKPLKLLGSITTNDPKTLLDTKEEVEVRTTLGNQTQYFSNAEINRFFNVDENLDDDYENFIDLYLDGGLDGDESPIDEFKLVNYRQVVYPKEKYTYKNYMRGRSFYVSRYWRDYRPNRTTRDVNNGFGFQVFSQSAWVLDAEEDFKNLSFTITPGTFTFTNPANIVTGSATDSGSATSFLWWKSNAEGAKDTSIHFQGASPGGINSAGSSDDVGVGSRYGITRPAKYSRTNSTIAYASDDDGDGITDDYRIYVDPMMTSHTSSIEHIANRLEDRFIQHNYSVTKEFNFSTPPCSTRVADNGSATYIHPIVPYFNWIATSDSRKDKWRQYLTQSSISFWAQLAHRNRDASLAPNLLSGTLYQEEVDVDGVTYISKKVEFLPQDSGSIKISYGTVYTSSFDGSYVVFDALSKGGFQTTYTNIYGHQNRFYQTHSADTLEPETISGELQSNLYFTAEKPNHFWIELNQSASLYEGNLAGADAGSAHPVFSISGSRFQTNVASLKPTKVVINAQEATLSSSVDLFKFFTGSVGKLDDLNGNKSIKIRGAAPTNFLSAPSFYDFNTHGSTGFGFSYWLKFGDVDGTTEADPAAAPNLLTTAPHNVLSVKDVAGNNIISHYLKKTNTAGPGGAATDTVLVTAFSNSIGRWVNYATRSVMLPHDSSVLTPNDYWYHISYSLITGSSGRMQGKFYVNGQNLPWADGNSIYTKWDDTVTKHADHSSMTGAPTNRQWMSGSYFHVGSNSLQLFTAETTADGQTPRSDWDNVSIDEFVFWNCGLTEDQHTDIYNSRQYKQFQTSDYPPTGRSLGAKTTATDAILRSATIMPLIGVHYTASTGIGTRTRASHPRYTHRVHPLGRNKYPGHFRTDIVGTTPGAGDDGKFDIACWFKTVAAPYRTRGLRVDSITADSAGPVYRSTLLDMANEGKPILISCWVQVHKLPPSTPNRHMIWCGDDIYLYVDQNGRISFQIRYNGLNYYHTWESSLYLKPGQKWKHLMVHWNGLFGRTGEVYFVINGGEETEFHSDSSRDEDAPLHHTGLPFGEFRIAANPPMKEWDSAGSISVAEFSIILDPPDPTEFAVHRDKLYNGGQRTDVKAALVDSGYMSASVDYGGQGSTTGGSPSFGTPNGGVEGSYGHRFLYKPYNTTLTFDDITNWSYPSAFGQGGITISFYFYPGNSYSTVNNSDDFTLFRLEGLDGSTYKKIVEFKRAGDETTFSALSERTNGQESNVLTDGVFEKLFDGYGYMSTTAGKHFIFTWDGTTDGMGKNTNCKIYIDGTEYTSQTLSAAKTGVNLDVSTLYDAVRLVFPSNNSADHRYWLCDLMLLDQYVGGDSSSSQRQNLRIKHDTQGRDPTFAWTAREDVASNTLSIPSNELTSLNNTTTTTNGWTFTGWVDFDEASTAYTTERLFEFQDPSAAMTARVSLNAQFLEIKNEWDGAGFMTHQFTGSSPISGALSDPWYSRDPLNNKTKSGWNHYIISQDPYCGNAPRFFLNGAEQFVWNTTSALDATRRSAGVLMLNSQLTNSSMTANADGNKTFSFWIKRPATVSHPLHSAQTDYVLSFNDSTTGGNRAVAYWDSSNRFIWSDYKLRISDSTRIPEGYAAFTSVDTSEWTHIAIVQDITNNKTLYYANGELTHTLVHDPAVYESALLPFDGIEIGDSDSNYAGAGGAISDLTIWNKHLTQNEIKLMYNGGHLYDYRGHPQKDYLWDWWKLDSVQGFEPHHWRIGMGDLFDSSKSTVNGSTLGHSGHDLTRDTVSGTNIGIANTFEGSQSNTFKAWGFKLKENPYIITSSTFDDSIADYTSAADHNGDWSCAFWWKPRRSTGGPNGVTGKIIDHQDAFHVYQDDDELVVGVYDTSGGNYTTFTSSGLGLSAGTWAHIVITVDWDGANSTVKMYKDGERYSPVINATYAYQTRQHTTTQLICRGDKPTTGTDNGTAMHHLAFWKDYVLPGGEIAFLSRYPVPPYSELGTQPLNAWALEINNATFIGTYTGEPDVGDAHGVDFFNQMEFPNEGTQSGGWKFAVLEQGCVVDSHTYTSWETDNSYWTTAGLSNPLTYGGSTPNGFSVCWFMKFENGSEWGPYNPAIILSIPGPNGSPLVSVRAGATGALSFSFREGNTEWLTRTINDASSYRDGVWRMWVATWDGTYASAPIIYAGLLSGGGIFSIAGTTDTSGTSWTGATNLGATNISFGGRVSGMHAEAGAVDVSFASLSVWNTQLNNTDIADLYTNQNPITHDKKHYLLAFYSGANPNNASDRLRDVSGNENDMWLQGAAASIHSWSPPDGNASTMIPGPLSYRVPTATLVTNNLDDFYLNAGGSFDKLKVEQLAVFTAPMVTNSNFATLYNNGVPLSEAVTGHTKYASDCWAFWDITTSDGSTTINDAKGSRDLTAASAVTINTGEIVVRPITPPKLWARMNDYSGDSLSVIKNRMTRNPNLLTYFRAGSEPELHGLQVGSGSNAGGTWPEASKLRQITLNNSGSDTNPDLSNSDYVASGSALHMYPQNNVYLSSGPKQWTVDQYLNDRRTNEQAIFNWTNGIQNDSTDPVAENGIQLLLSASGGTYKLVKKIGKQHYSSARHTVAADYSFTPNKWYFLYATFKNFIGGHVGQECDVYIDGEKIAGGHAVNTAGAWKTNWGSNHASSSNTFIAPYNLSNRRFNWGAGDSDYGTNFGGFFQDICIWKNNDLTRKDAYKYLAEGMFTGSNYVDTSDSNLAVAIKSGYPQGGTQGNFNAVVKNVDTDGPFFYVGSSSPSIVTSVMDAPKPLYVEGENVTNIFSFWFKPKIEASNEGQTLFSLFSDEIDPSGKWQTVDNSVSSWSQVDQNTSRTEALSVTYDPDRTDPDGSGTLIVKYNFLRSNSSNWEDQRFYSSNYHFTLSMDLSPLTHYVLLQNDDRIALCVNGALVATVSTNFSATKVPLSFNNVQIGATTVTTEKLTLRPLQTGAIIDELAIVRRLGVSHSDFAGIASRLYNNGHKWNFQMEQERFIGSADNGAVLYWWRLGESDYNAGDALSSQISILRDHSFRASGSSGWGQGSEELVSRNLTTLEGNKWEIATSTNTTSDILCHYGFNEVVATTDEDVGTSVANTTTFTSSVGGPGITVYGSGWVGDFTFDSYLLHTFKWLSVFKSPNFVTVLGKHGQGRGVTSKGSTDTEADALTSQPYGETGYALSDIPNLSRTWIPEFAIFAGTGSANEDSSINDPKTKSKLTINIHTTDFATDLKGKSIYITKNPHKVGGDSATTKRLQINFKDTGGVDSTFTTMSTEASIDGFADINITNGMANTKALLSDALVALLDDSGGLDADGSDYNYDNNAGSVDGKTTITSVNAGGNGLYQLIGSSTTSLISFTSSVGYDHITKALTSWPSFGYKDQRDSDFQRAISSTGSGVGTLRWGAKPYVYYRGTTDLGSWANLGHSQPYSNIDSSDTTNNMNLKMHYDEFAGYGGAAAQWSLGSDTVNRNTGQGFAIDSGSSVSFSLSSTPNLDINFIPLDYNKSFVNGTLTSFTSPSSPNPLIGGSLGARSKFAPGILQNNYNQFTNQITYASNERVDKYLSASACYFRRHSLTSSTSLVSPYGGFLNKISASSGLEGYDSMRTRLTGNIIANHLYLGSAKWETGDFAGYFDIDGNFVKKPKYPFGDRYSDFLGDARPIMKDYGIVPEFRMSDHVARFLAIGPKEEKLDLFNMSGGLPSADSSDKSNFYTVYSTTDFLKHFEIVQEDHSDFVDPFSIKLKCSAIKKFLPYEGFYPAQRTVQIAQQFYESYKDNVNITGADAQKMFAEEDNNYGVQYLLNPLFSPGIMFNTIKSGVACDFPLITDTGSIKRIGGEQDGGAMIRQPFDTRIPFEALIEPEKYLAGVRLASNEPDPNGDVGLQVEWGGQGNELYHLMISNFLAEVPEFFLQNKSFTTIASLSQGDPNFGNARKGVTYMMRLKMYRTISGSKSPLKNDLGKSFSVPQDTGSVFNSSDQRVGPGGAFNYAQGSRFFGEKFTMYSRPSAFGPPQSLVGGTGPSLDITFTEDSTPTAAKKIEFMIPLDEGEFVSGGTASESRKQYNIYRVTWEDDGSADSTETSWTTGSANAGTDTATEEQYRVQFYTAVIDVNTTHNPSAVTHQTADDLKVLLDKIPDCSTSIDMAAGTYGGGNGSNGTSHRLRLTRVAAPVCSEYHRFITDYGAITTNTTNVTLSATNEVPLLVPNTWSEFKFDGSDNFSYITGSARTGHTTKYAGTGSEGEMGYNYPFTPPYYHGEAWADITFVPTETKKYTLQEIINNSSVEFYRHFDSGSVDTNTIPFVSDRTVLINDQAMQLASSVNLFSQGVLEQDITALQAEGIKSTTAVQVDTDITNKYRWIIQTKFETPIFNFNHYTYATGSGDYGITLPGVGPAQTPIGMWHQYGQMPQNSEEGVFLQVDDLPKTWLLNAMRKTTQQAKRTQSLASLCGFSTDPIRLGELDGLVEISEAVVAVPFYEKNNRRQFFPISRRDVRNALDPARKNLVGETIIDMVEKMQKFVFPPSFDFVKNRRIRPFSMYIFEFTDTLSKQDLADIWQNLPPERFDIMQEETATISHELLSYELLGRGARLRRGRNSEDELLRGDRAESIHPNIQWMVFKVKQRGTANYFEKIFQRNESQQLLSQRLKLGVSADTLGRKRDVAYNWPYDFFSLVEGIKLTADIDFLEVDEEQTQAQEKFVPKVKRKLPRIHKEAVSTIKKDVLKGISGTPPVQEPPKPPLTEKEIKKVEKRGKIKRPRRVKNTAKEKPVRKRETPSILESKNKNKK